MIICKMHGDRAKNLSRHVTAARGLGRRGDRFHGEEARKISWSLDVFLLPSQNVEDRDKAMSIITMLPLSSFREAEPCIN